MQANKKNDLYRDNIFHSLLNNDLSREEKEIQRVVEEALLLVGAGQLTTADVLSMIFYLLLKNPDKLEALRYELDDAIPDLNSMPHLSKLE